MPKTWTPPKDPDDIVDYGYDWSGKFAEDTLDDTITAVNATVISGAVVVDSSDIDGMITRHWLSGGEDGETAEIRLRINTNAGRQFDQTVRIKVKTK